MTDFEMSILNACEEQFPAVPIAACFFHLSQSMYRKIQSEGLQVQYNDPNDDTIRKYTHMILALAFVPLEDVLDAFATLENDAPDELLNIFDYFNLNYVNGRRAQGRRARVLPRFPPCIWNQYTATINNSHKTNNISEGWHNRFRILVAINHPDLYTFIQEIKKEQADTEKQIIEMDLGRNVKANPRMQCLSLQKRQRIIAQNYRTYKHNNEILNYLQNMGSNIHIS